MARYLKSVFDVARNFGRRKGLKACLHSDPLSQLGQLRLRQTLSQLRLAGQNDLHQFTFGSFEIGEQAHSFQHRGGKILRFINEDYHPPTSLGFAEQELVQLRVHAHDVFPIGL